jgi:hypothetical protein
MGVILDSRFATAEGTAATLGVSEARMKRLIRLAGPKAEACRALRATTNGHRAKGKLKAAPWVAKRKKQARGKANKAAH